MDSTVSRTLALARRLGVPVDADGLTRLVAAHPWILAEWSINAAGDPRGRLRLSLWTRAGAAGPVPGLPAGGIDGFGFALGEARATRRWYREASPGFGDTLYAAVIRALPQLAAPAAALVEAAGRPLHYGAVGLELDGGAVRRATAYVSPPDRAALRRMLRVAGLEGLDDTFPRGAFDGPSWARVYVARSVGEAGGWKLYYGARNHLDRVPNDVLLATAGVEDPRGELGAAGRVQVLGLNVGDDGRRSWTAYFAER